MVLLAGILQGIATIAYLRPLTNPVPHHVSDWPFDPQEPLRLPISLPCYNLLSGYYYGFSRIVNTLLILHLPQILILAEISAQPKDLDTEAMSVFSSVSIRSELFGIRPTKIDLALSIPPDTKGIVILAHGGGSNKTSPRNQLVAGSLRRAGFATVLTDLLGPEEQEKDKRTFEYRFNIALLAERLASVINWLKSNPAVSDLPIGLFGASTGAAAAITAAASASMAKALGINAIVSRGGRPDLVKPEHLGTIETPTLFIVGENDTSVLKLTRETFKGLKKMKEKEIVVIQGAGHLFEESGSLDQVSELATRWFRKYLTSL